MSRQVNIKALVSHIVKGDGLDRCRICMGETTEGQVFLSDTVLLEENNPITLSELLRTITGIEVPLEDGMPPGLCTLCNKNLSKAWKIRNLFIEATNKWNNILTLLSTTPSPNELQGNPDSIQIILADTYVSFATNKVVPKNKNIVKYEKESVSKLECLDCGKQFIYPKLLALHLERSTELKRACHVCGAIRHRDELVVHLQSAHNLRPLICNKCHALLPSPKELKKHEAKIHSLGSHSCVDCRQTFKSPYALNAHAGVHASKSCPGCDKLFRNHMCYIHHVKQCCKLDLTVENTHVTKNKITIEVKNRKTDKKIKVGLRGSAFSECYCDYCNKKFSGKKFLAAHILRAHTTTTHSPCLYCGKVLAAVNMPGHIKKHTRTEIFQCEHCSLKLRTKLGYLQHVRLHTGELPYKCQHCDESFSGSSRRSEHIRKVHKKIERPLKYECNLCPARFNLPYKLRNHLNVAHADTSGDHKQFACVICKEKVGSLRGLVHHEKKHQRSGVEADENLPDSICPLCLTNAKLCAKFRSTCLKSAQNWIDYTNYLQKIRITAKNKAVFVMIEEKKMLNVTKPIEKTPKNVLKELKLRLNISKASTRKKDAIINLHKRKFTTKTSCPFCKKPFLLKYLLNIHLRNTDYHCCLYCSKLIERNCLIEHYRKHSRIISQCTICLQIFFCRDKAADHINVCQSKPVACIDCNFTSISKEGLEVHRSIHKPHICSGCDTKFVGRKCYIYHKGTCVKYKKKLAKFICDYCSRVYSQKPAFVKHILKHSRGKTHQCDVCGKKFLTFHHLKEHAESHDKITDRYVCEFCNKKFCSRRGYERHLRKHMRVENVRSYIRHKQNRNVPKKKKIVQEPGIPEGLCNVCAEETVKAHLFKQLCTESFKHWNTTINHFTNLNEQINSEKAFFVFYNIEGTTIIKDQIVSPKNSKEAVARLNQKVTEKRRILKPRSKHKPVKCKCPDCGRRFNNYHDLSAHLAKSSKRVCEECGLIVSKQKLIQHFKKKHGLSFAICHKCYRQFDDAAALEIHHTECHMKGKHSCHFCGEEFSDRGLKAHLYSHSLFHCDSCPKSFSNRKCFEYHKKLCKTTHVPKPSLFICNDCGSQYNRKVSLRIHIIQKHLNVLPYVCSVCGKRVSTMGHLRSHLQVHQEVRKVLECKFCGAKMRTENGLTLHMRIHTGEKPYKCSECGEEFLSSSRRTDHIKRKHRSVFDQPHECPNCPARFIRPFELRKHMKNVHFEVARQIEVTVS